MRRASAFCRNLQLCWHEAHCQGQTRLPGVLLPSPGFLFPPVPATLGWAAHGCLPLFVFLRGLIDCRCSPHTFADQSQKILSRERMNCQSLVKWTLQVQSHPSALLLIFIWNVYWTSYTNKIKHCLKDRVRTRKNRQQNQFFSHELQSPAPLCSNNRLLLTHTSTLNRIWGYLFHKARGTDLKIFEEVKYLESASLVVAPWVQLQFGHLFLEIWAR